MAETAYMLGLFNVVIIALLKTILLACATIIVVSLVVIVSRN